MIASVKSGVSPRWPASEWSHDDDGEGIISDAPRLDLLPAQTFGDDIGW
jgi:hypothetical protein